MIQYGHGVGLRRLTRSDMDFAFSWRNNSEIYKWCRQREPLSYKEHEAWFDSLHGRKDVSMFAIACKELGSFPIGVCGLTSIDLVNRHAEFSLYIGPDHQGKGYAKAALKTLCEYGFNVLGLNHIFGETFDGNPAAGLFEKVGFKKDGTRRSYYFREGKFIDAHLYSLLAKEFSP